jgi:hypothetical protein
VKLYTFTKGAISVETDGATKLDAESKARECFAKLKAGVNHRTWRRWTEEEAGWQEPTAPIAQEGSPAQKELGF